MDNLKKITNAKLVSSLTTAELKELQKALCLLGYDCQPIDGKFGPTTKNAWAKFKKDNKQSTPDKIGAGSVKILLDKLAALYPPSPAPKPTPKPTPKPVSNPIIASSRPPGECEISEAGIRALANREGKRNSKYKDSVGLWTIGIGHLIMPGEVFPEVMTDAQVYDLFRKDLRRYEDAVRRAVLVPLTQNQYDALVSFVFNIGIGGFNKSTVLKRLNKSDYPGAADAMLMWNKPPEIIGRRQTEIKQFLS